MARDAGAVRVAVVGGRGVAGRRVVEALVAAGHDALVIGRRDGVDARTGAGLPAALDGVGAVVDASNPGVTEELAATAFYTDVASSLQRTGAAAGVAHLVVLSIVGVDHPDAGRVGFYAANLRHEQVARAGAVPVTVVRATQFHEFPAQLLRRVRIGPVAAVPAMRVQTVAASAVGAALASIAVRAPAGGLVEVTGPGPATDLPALVRTTARRRGQRTAVVGLPLPGRTGRALRSGALLAGPDAEVVGPSFDEWLLGDDPLDV